mmetsp:Transcript_50952/g.163048  ORF Transcript_50952/g.163048 Transcript_50952/m.163048 type:complete len:243 (-) Transcript_50952:91-819(-)
MARVTSRVQKIWLTLSTTCPGQSRIQSLRGLVGNASTLFLCTVWREACICSWHLSSHCSTPLDSPLGSTSLSNGTFSPSRETMPVIMSSSSNTSSFTASKHFFTKGWTFRGSLVSERISRSSSLERNQKRGNAIFFVSRYVLSCFSISARDLECSRSCSRVSSEICRIPGALRVFSMSSRQNMSMTWKASPSLRICFMISSLPNTGCRYIHLLCTTSHSSNVSCTWLRVPSQFLIRSKKGLA